MSDVDVVDVVDVRLFTWNFIQIILFTFHAGTKLRKRLVFFVFEIMFRIKSSILLEANICFFFYFGPGLIQ